MMVGGSRFEGLTGWLAGCEGRSFRCVAPRCAAASCDVCPSLCFLSCSLCHDALQASSASWPSSWARSRGPDPTTQLRPGSLQQLRAPTTSGSRPGPVAGSIFLYSHPGLHEQVWVWVLLPPGSSAVSMWPSKRSGCRGARAESLRECTSGQPCR